MGPGCEGLTGGGAKCLGLLCKAHDWQVMMEREGLSDGYGALRNTALMRLLSFCSFRATCFSMFKVKAVPPKHYFGGLRLQAIIPVLQASRKKKLLRGCRVRKASDSECQGLGSRFRSRSGLRFQGSGFTMMRCMSIRSRHGECQHGFEPALHPTIHAKRLDPWTLNLRSPRP